MGDRRSGCAHRRRGFCRLAEGGGWRRQDDLTLHPPAIGSGVEGLEGRANSRRCVSRGGRGRGVGEDVSAGDSDVEGACEDGTELKGIGGGLSGDELAVGAAAACPLGVSTSLVIALKVRAVELVEDGASLWGVVKRSVLLLFGPKSAVREGCA